MKQFLFRVSIFLAIQCVIALVLLTNFLSQSKLGYLASFQDKLALLASHDQPSLIFLGGSNVAFGIDSQKLSQQTGYPVINAGLHSALGLDFYLAMADAYACQGDLVVVTPEWDLLSGNFQPNSAQLQQLLRESPVAWRLFLANQRLESTTFLDQFGLQEIAYAIQHGTIFRSSAAHSEMMNVARTPGVYSRLNFDEHGDFVGHHGLGTIQDIESLPCRLKFNRSKYLQAAAKINELADRLRSRGASVVFAYAPLPECFNNEHEFELQQAHQFLTENLRVPVLHHPNDTSFPTDCFYDTIYHLNESGKTARTDLVASSLNKILPLSNGIVTAFSHSLESETVRSCGSSPSRPFAQSNPRAEDQFFVARREPDPPHESTRSFQ